MEVEELKNIIKTAKEINDEVKKIISSKHKLITNTSNIDKEFLHRVDNELKQGIKYIKDDTRSGNTDIILAIDMFSNASITINQLKRHEKSNVGKNEKFIELCLFMDKLYEKITKYA